VFFSLDGGLFFTKKQSCGEALCNQFWSLCAITRRLGASHRIVEVYLGIYNFSFSRYSGFSHARGSRVSPSGKGCSG
jgi:hypothetical protein